MSVLEELEQVAAEERSAMLRADWHALQSVVERKLTLAEQLREVSLGQGGAELQRISERFRYNQALASTLSRSLGDLLSASIPPPTYGRQGRIAPKVQRVMSVCG